MTSHDFCRGFLKLVMKDIRKNVPKAIIKKSWAYKYDDGTVEFHINHCKELPEGFYWYGRGCCLWNAKSSGWNEYLYKLSKKKER